MFIGYDCAPISFIYIKVLSLHLLLNFFIAALSILIVLLNIYLCQQLSLIFYYYKKIYICIYNDNKTGDDI